MNHAPPEASEIHHEASSTNGLIPKSTPILNSDGEPIWKVLVFDNLGRDVISSVLRVNDLRGWGITIHLYVQAHPCTSAVAMDAETLAVSADSSMSEISMDKGTQYPMFPLYI